MRGVVSVPIALALLAGACGGAGTAPGSASPGGAAATATATPAPAPVDLQVSYSNVRSEEHTSELQSQSNLVCRLLLEKKKTKRQNRPTTHFLQPPETRTSATISVLLSAT